MDLWNNINGFNNLRSVAHVPASTSKLKIEAIAYTRKRQAKQPCLNIKGATESDRCSSSVQMDDIHVGLGDLTKAAGLHACI